MTIHGGGPLFEKKIEYYQFDGVSIAYSKIPWDSEYLNNNTYEIINIKGNENNFDNAFCEFKNFLCLKERDLLFVKIISLDNANIITYSKLGFYFVEQTIDPISNLNKFNCSPVAKYIRELDKITEQDLEQVYEIASNTFTNDRYHIDKNIDHTSASLRFKKWVENSYKLNEDIYLLKFQEKILGFIILAQNGKEVDMKLGGISQEYIGLGLGLTVFVSTLVMLKNLGVRKVRTRISLNNTSILNLYSFLGFRFQNPMIVMHYVIT